MSLIANFPQTCRPVTVHRSGKVVARSKNLAAITRYARKSPVNIVELRPLPDNWYGVAFFYWDGAAAFTRWASWTVALEFITARRSWNLTRVTIDERLSGSPHEVAARGDRVSRAIAKLRKNGTVVTFRTYRDATPL